MEFIAPWNSEQIPLYMPTLEKHTMFITVMWVTSLDFLCTCNMWAKIVLRILTVIIGNETSY